MVSRVNGTKFPYVREYSQPTSLPAQSGRGRGRGSSGRGTGKGGAPKGSLAATPKRPPRPLESSSQQKKAKSIDKSHSGILQEMCDKSGLDPTALLRIFVDKAVNLDPNGQPQPQTA